MRKQIHDEGYRRLAASTQFSTKLTTKLTHALPHPHTPTLIFRLNLSLSHGDRRYTCWRPYFLTLPSTNVYPCFPAIDLPRNLASKTFCPGFSL